MMAIQSALPLRVLSLPNNWDLDKKTTSYAIGETCQSSKSSRKNRLHSSLKTTASSPLQLKGPHEFVERIERTQTQRKFVTVICDMYLSNSKSIQTMGRFVTYRPRDGNVCSPPAIPLHRSRHHKGEKEGISSEPGYRSTSKHKLIAVFISIGRNVKNTPIGGVGIFRNQT